MIAVEMAVTVCRATAGQIALATSSVQEGAPTVLRHQPEAQTWEGNVFHLSCSDPQDDFSALNCF